jgi:mycothiol synthase
MAIENKRIIGFCWTKIHHDFVNQDPIGELYVLGVDPDSHAKGIGKSVATTALKYLSQKGLSRAMLYVDADNLQAMRFYLHLGFE